MALPQSTGQLAPTTPGERHEILDVVRGFALLGVVVVNWYWTGVWDVLTLEQRQALPTARLDSVVQVLDHMFFDDKFYTLFSMLFGLGFALQLERSASRGRNLIPIYRRRLTILFLIGVAHAIFLYGGDILHTYALLGFALLPFRNRSDRFILGCALAIALVVLSLPSIEWFISVYWPDANIGGAQEPRHAERLLAVTASGWQGIIWFNLNLLRADYFEIWAVGWYLSIFWKFLFGFWVGRQALLRKAGEHVALYRRLLPWALVVGLAGNALSTASLWLPDNPVYPEAPFPTRLAWVFVECGVVALAVAYVCALVLIHQHPAGRRFLGALAPLGRMALTNYLMQSVVFVFLFYGVGLGLAGRIGVAAATVLAIATFFLQIVFSGWWLRRFRFGPAEWAWRSASYGSWMPIRWAAQQRVAADGATRRR